MVVHRHSAAGFYRPGDGVQRLGRDGEGALRLRLLLPRASALLGVRGAGWDVCPDEPGLPPFALAGSGVFHARDIPCCCCCSVFFLDRSHNTHRWFRLGPLSFQPSELAKLALILFLAWLLAQRAKGQAMEDWHNLLAPAVGHRGSGRPDCRPTRPGDRHRLRPDCRHHAVRGRH